MEAFFEICSNLKNSQMNRIAWKYQKNQDKRRCYCKKTVYNAYYTENLCELIMLIVWLLVSSRLLVVNFGESKLPVDF